MDKQTSEDDVVLIPGYVMDDRVDTLDLTSQDSEYVLIER